MFERPSAVFWIPVENQRDFISTKTTNHSGCLVFPPNSYLNISGLVCSRLSPVFADGNQFSWPVVQTAFIHIVTDRICKRQLILSKHQIMLINSAESALCRLLTSFQGLVCFRCWSGFTSVSKLSFLLFSLEVSRQTAALDLLTSQRFLVDLVGLHKSVLWIREDLELA